MKFIILLFILIYYEIMSTITLRSGESYSKEVKETSISNYRRRKKQRMSTLLTGNKKVLQSNKNQNSVTKNNENINMATLRKLPLINPFTKMFNDSKDSSRVSVNK